MSELPTLLERAADEVNGAREFLAIERADDSLLCIIKAEELLSEARRQLGQDTRVCGVKL